MLIEYVDAALRQARYKILPDDEGFFGEIRGFKGVWANTSTLETCRDELREALEDWIVVRLRSGLTLPVVSGISLNQRHPRKHKIA